MTDPKDVLAAALVKANGFTPDAAYRYVYAFIEQVLTDSDHSAYRILADKVSGLIPDGDAWDGDESEE